MEERGGIGHVQTSDYNMMNNFWRFNVQPSDCSYRYSIIYLKVAKREWILNVFTTKRKWQLCDLMQMLANAMVVISFAVYK